LYFSCKRKAPTMTENNVQITKPAIAFTTSRLVVSLSASRIENVPNEESAVANKRKRKRA
jgi:hypothetical protein